MPKYQTIIYMAIKEGVFAYQPKADKPNEKIPLPKCLSIELQAESIPPIHLCDPFYCKIDPYGDLRGKKLTGLFETIKPKIWSGDVLHNGKKNTLLIAFNNAYPIYSNWLKVYYFFGFYVTPNRISELIYTTFIDRQKQGYSF